MPCSSCAASFCMYCQKASCASVITVCCRIASANNCCRWHAPCSPHRVANRSLCCPCPTTHSGSAPAAEKPCASSNASPLHNSTSQASIPHEPRRHPAPPACFSHVFPAVCVTDGQQPHLLAQPCSRTAPSQIAPPSDPRPPSAT